MFEVLLDTPAQKTLRKLDKTTVLRILKAVEKLADDPIPHDSKRVIGYNEKVFRVRVGKYRILYRLDYEKFMVVVINIDSRDRVYDRI
ncbi:MAG: type II toxin-antitoxin system RelE/ParE family toxin [Methanosarcinaceae archaeon]|nr:type II toxin-antitoxin system RelE/ParE family toxin [Methanosarcinaceae archaeon]